MDETDAPERAEGPTAARDGAENASSNGNGNGKSIADQAAEEVPVPEPQPLGGQGTLPIPGGKGRKHVEMLVVINQGETKGAGQIDVEGEQLLIVRAEYANADTRPVRDGERRVTGWKYVQKLRPTWVETFDDYLEANGLKIVRVDEPGEAIDPENLVNIEELRRERKDAIGG
jgi:hypothetical protein